MCTSAPKSSLCQEASGQVKVSVPQHASKLCTKRVIISNFQVFVKIKWDNMYNMLSKKPRT